MYSKFGTQNVIRDYNKLQGTTHPTDLSYQIIRDYNSRYVTVQNSAVIPIGISITSYLTGKTPDILFILQGGEIKHLGLNSHNSGPQYIWLLSPKDGSPVGNPTCLKENSNDFVVRNGINKWWIQFFSRPSYSAAH